MTFHFSIGGYFGSSFVARIKEGELECREFTRDSPEYRTCYHERCKRCHGSKHRATQATAT